MNVISSFVPALHNISEWVAIASLKTIPLIAFVLILQRLFRKQLSASSRHLLWLSVLMSLSIPFGWNVSLDHITTNDSPAVISSDQTGDSRDTKNSNAPIFQQQTDMSNDVIRPLPGTAPKNMASLIGASTQILRNHYGLILACLWLSGVIILLSLTALSAFHFHRIKANSSAATTDLLHLFTVCKMEMRVNKSIQLLLTHDIQSPITLGWLWPAVVLPKNIEQQLSSENLKHVLLHELGHIKRHDIFFNWAACLINILHWFNPFIWVAFKRMRMDMEIACDALVLTHLHKSQRKNYGATLIEISEIPQTAHRAILTLGILENHTDLKERLKMIKEFTTMNLKNTLLFGAILMATTITSLAQPAASTVTKPAAAVESKTTTHSESSITLQKFATLAEKDLKVKILVGQDDALRTIPFSPNNELLNYGQLLTQLKINEYTAYKSKDYIQIIKMRDARNLSIPVVEKGKTYYEDEMVTDYLKPEKSCINHVLAAIRPLVPQYGHLTGMDEGTLIIVDTYGNIQRLKSVIKSIDDNIDKPMDCNPKPQSEKK